MFDVIQERLRQFVADRLGFLHRPQCAFAFVVAGFGDDRFDSVLELQEGGFLDFQETPILVVGDQFLVVFKFRIDLGQLRFEQFLGFLLGLGVQRDDVIHDARSGLQVSSDRPVDRFQARDGFFVSVVGCLKYLSRLQIACAGE